MKLFNNPNLKVVKHHITTLEEVTAPAAAVRNLKLKYLFVIGQNCGETIDIVKEELDKIRGYFPRILPPLPPSMPYQPPYRPFREHSKMKRYLIQFMVCLVAGGVIFLFHLWNYSLPIFWAVLVHMVTFSNALLGLLLMGTRISRALGICAIAIISTVFIMRATTHRTLAPQVLYEVSSVRMLDQMLWVHSGGQFLMVMVDPTLEFGRSCIITSSGEPVRTPEQFQIILKTCTGIDYEVGYRIGACDLAFRTTGLVITPLELFTKTVQEAREVVSP